MIGSASCTEKPDGAGCPNIRTSREGEQSCYVSDQDTIVCNFTCSSGFIYSGVDLKNSEVCKL